LKIVRNANRRPDVAVNSPAMNQVSDWQCGCTPSAAGNVNSGSPGTKSKGVARPGSRSFRGAGVVLARRVGHCYLPSLSARGFHLAIIAKLNYYDPRRRIQSGPGVRSCDRIEEGRLDSCTMPRSPGW